MCRVLLADDEKLEREALKIIINRYLQNVYVVGEARSGKEAIEMSTRLDPDVVFMDIKMPGIDGLCATQTIKKIDPNKKIILISAYDDFKFAQKAVRIKADDYLVKPVRPQKIVDLLKKHIQDNKSYILKKKKKELLAKIIDKDYTGAKKSLKEIIEQIEKVYSKNDPQDIVDFAINLATNMIYATNMDHEKIENEDFKKQLNYTFDIKKVALFLSKVLDDVFKKIISNKQLFKNNELSLALNYIEQNFKEHISLKDVSNYIHLSTCYTSKLFKRELGINFSKYLIERKISEAKKLLTETDMHINDIAFDIGYNEPNYFCNVFKKAEGLTPSQYRKKKKKSDSSF